MKCSSNMTTQQKNDLSQDNSNSSATDVKEQPSQSTTNLAAAASFFARAGKKTISNTTDGSMKKKKKTDHSITKPDFITNFSEMLKVNAPPIPPTLIKTPLNRPLGHNAGKIKIIIRLKYVECAKQEGSQTGSPSQSFITVDGSKKQVTVIEPPSATSTPRRMNTIIPKIFAFDAVYTDDDDQIELCSNALTDIIQAVVSGIDGCIFSFGHLKGVSSFTMIGSDQQIRKLGLIPCAISWLFRLIYEQKEKTGARFSVRVSAIEVHGKQETLKDLLSDVDVLDTIGQCSPGVYLRDDPVSGTQLQNQSELRAPTAEKAAFYLDAALAARTVVTNEEDARLCHFLFTLHVYQYRVERGMSGSAVAGGRSRLHMLDFASGRTVYQTSDPNNKEPLSPHADFPKPEIQSISTALSLSATAAVLLALVNGQRHIPYRTSKLSQLLREAMSSLSCRTCMIAQVAMNNSLFADSMQIIQFATKMQRLKRRKLSKFSGTSSDDSSSCDSFGLRRASRFRTGNIGFSSESSNGGMTSSEADYTSSSDQSCDTVIYLGASRIKGGDDHSSFMLRKRRISAPSFTNAIAKKSGSESDLTKISISRHHMINNKPSVRTNALAWPKVAAKNAVETLSTQKEMWVDGPKAVFENDSSGKSDDVTLNQAKFVNMETQTYLLEETQNMKENQLTRTDQVELSHDISKKKNIQLTETIFSPQETQDINLQSKHSTISVTNESPIPIEPPLPGIGSSDSDKRSNITNKVDLVPQLPTCHKAQLINSNPLSTHLQNTSNDVLVSVSKASKPFVWDWVEKHSDMVVCSPFVKDSGSHPFQCSSKEESQSPQKKVVKHCSKHQQLLAMKKIKQIINTESPATVNEREGRKRHKSVKYKPAQIPSSYDSNFVVSNISASTEPAFTRVAEWVRSVSEETSRTQSLSPVRRNNNCKDGNIPTKFPINVTTTTPSTSDFIYHSLDRHDQTYMFSVPPKQYINYSNDSFGISSGGMPYSCLSSGSRTFDSNPLSILHSYQKESVTSKILQECAQTIHTSTESETWTSHNPLMKTNSQTEDKIVNTTTQQKSHLVHGKHNNHSSTKHNKNSSSQQQVDRSSPSKGRSTSLIKNAFFGRCRLSSNNNIDETNLYSVPNSPFKSKTGSNNSTAKCVELNSLTNTGGYHYVVMTSSVSTPAKNVVEENVKVSKKRSSSTSPGKSSSSSNDKKQITAQTASKKEKSKEKHSKENRSDTKIKNKKESKGRLSFLTSPLFGKRKDKDKYLAPIPKLVKPKKASIPSQKDAANNDSPSKVISPYSTVTQPKHSSHSSSGHGSDCSSIYGHHHKYGELSGQIKCGECTNIDEENPCLTHIDTLNIDQHNLMRRSQRRGGGHTSSGYESIMRDSEVSSQNDSTSESSLGAAPRPQTPEKQQSQSSSSSSKQSRSAPNRSEETSEDTQSPVSVRKMSPKTAIKFQVKSQQQRENEIKKISKQIQFEKIYDLLAQQDIMKTELMQSKERILVDPSSWSYDLHVVEQMDPEDSSFIEALEKETDILRRRVEACKSHVLLLTYFDCKYHNQLLSDTNSPYTYGTSQRKSVSVGTTADPFVNADHMTVDIRKTNKP